MFRIDLAMDPPMALNLYYHLNLPYLSSKIVRMPKLLI